MAGEFGFERNVLLQSVCLVIVGANHRACVGQVSMELGCEAAEAQLELHSLIQVDSILRQQKKKRPQQAFPAPKNKENEVQFVVPPLCEELYSHGYDTH
ncbi:hypothetical protein NQZ68_004971 [Dissostichus eleginoides]|nr:hypothetical protein NQZ68_004971 [Dissostichus eleginoides]